MFKFSQHDPRLELLELLGSDETEIFDVKLSAEGSAFGPVEYEITFRYTIVPKAMVPLPNTEQVRARAQEIIAKFTKSR